ASRQARARNRPPGHSSICAVLSRLAGRPRTEHGALEVFVIAPAPAWRLPFEPTDDEQRHREYDHARGDVFLGSKHHQPGDAGQVQPKDHPALPDAGYTPSPAELLG